MAVPGNREIVIEAGRGADRYFRDLWSYRELFAFLAWRDILVRYKQTVLGVAWSVGKPLFAMLAFTFVFGKLAGLPSDGVPYPILVYAAMLPWQFFAGAAADGSNSLVANAGMLSKVYFPRMIVPAGAVIVNAVDLLVSLGVLGLLMAWYRFLPPARILALPLFFLPALLFTLGTGLWLSALNVRYRDVRHLVPFIVQFGLYVSPVGFSSTVVPDRWRLLFSLNPMAGVIDGFRWAILGTAVPMYWPGFFLSVGLAAILFATGASYFRRTERTFADVV